MERYQERWMTLTTTADPDEVQHNKQAFLNQACVLRLQKEGDVCVNISNFGRVDSKLWLRDILRRCGGSTYHDSGELPERVSCIMSARSLDKFSGRLKPPGPISGFDGRIRDFAVLDLLDRDDLGEAVLMLLLYMSSGMECIPRHLGLNLLRDTCLLIHKYNLHTKVQQLAWLWCPPRTMATIPRRYLVADMEAELCIGNILRRSSMLESGLLSAVGYSMTPLRIQHSSFPQSFLEQINTGRESLVAGLSDRLVRLLGHYAQGMTPVCSKGDFSCYMTALRTLVRKLCRLKHMQLGDSPMQVVPLQDALVELKSIRTACLCWQMQPDHGVGDREGAENFQVSVRGIIEGCKKDVDEVVEDLMLEWLQ